MKASIAFDVERCSGCRTCALACSFAFFKVFNPEKAHIELTADEERATFTLTLKEGCIRCRICSEACPFGVIRRSEGEGDDR